MNRRARALMGAALVLAHDTSVAIKHHPREHPWRKLSQLAASRIVSTPVGSALARHRLLPGPVRSNANVAQPLVEACWA